MPKGLIPKVIWWRIPTPLEMMNTELIQSPLGAFMTRTFCPRFLAKTKKTDYSINYLLVPPMMKHDETMLASWFSHCLIIPSLITSLLPSFLILSLIFLPLIHFQVLIHFISWSNMTGDRGWNEWNEMKGKGKTASSQPASNTFTNTKSSP